MSEEPIRRKRVLFVDDESLVLQGLQRMLRGMRSEWDMTFVEGGPQALEAMRKQPFDVVVTDMRMPGMNGAQLLNTLAGEFPESVRIVLSGHADQDLITQCLGSAHQYLSKPCDPDLLKRLINETCRLGDDIANERVRKVVGSIERLPSVPATYQRLSETLAQEETTAADLGRIIEQDMGMTVKILKLVNSAFFGLRRELTSPTEAVAYLGMETVRSLVLAKGIFEASEPLATRRITLDAIWAHGLAVGQGAKTILRLLKASEHDQNDALTSGLLHDIGTLILARHFPDLYDKTFDLVDSENLLLHVAEQRVLGVDHTEVGAYLVGLWGLPPVIVESVRFHHEPALSTGGIHRPTPVCAVHLADGMLRETPAHAAFEHPALDPVLLQTQWLANNLEAIRGSLHT